MSLTPAEKLMNKKVDEALEALARGDYGSSAPPPGDEEEWAIAKVAGELGVSQESVNVAWGRQ